MPKELFNHYTIISTDAAGSYTQAAYAAAFPREIGDILGAFDKWVAGKRPAAAPAPAPPPVHGYPAQSRASEGAQHRFMSGASAHLCTAVTTCLVETCKGQDIDPGNIRQH